MWKKATAVFLLAIVFSLIVWDVVAFLEGGVDSTISRSMARFGVSYGIVPLTCGVMAGHFWWPWRTDMKAITLPALAGIGMLTILLDVGCAGWVGLIPGGPLTVFVSGIPTGRFLWPQPARDRLDT